MLDTYLLAPIQQGILYESLIASRGAYLNQTILQSDESWDPDLLQRSLDALVARHPMLRTGFSTDESGMLLQQVHPEAPSDIESLDLGYIPKDEESYELERFLIADRRRGFDLARPPLIRLTLQRQSDAVNQMILTSHHAIIDARSLILILKELFILYDSYLRGVEARLPPVVSYREYVHWMQTQDFSHAEPFWRDMLEGFSAPTPLGIGDTSSATAASLDSDFNRYHSLRQSLPDNLFQRLLQIADQHDLSLNTIFQAAWGLLLKRYSGESDVLFGATRSCRYSALDGDTANLFGPILNTLPVHAHVTGSQRLVPFLEDLRQLWLEMRPYENTPLSMISAWSGIPPGKPLFNSLHNYESKSHLAGLRASNPGIKLDSLETIQITPYPLTFSVTAAPCLEINLGCDRSFIDDQATERLLGHLRTLLGEIASHPESRLSDLKMLTPSESHQILVEWNSTSSDHPAIPQTHAGLVHQRFEFQVARAPQRVAVIEGWSSGANGSRQLTYAELNALANKFANYLHKLGVGPEVRVGVCLERSIELAVAFLAILKAGGVYAPLDPDHPPERLAFQIQNSQPKVILVQDHLTRLLPSDLPPLIFLDGDWSEVIAESDQNPIVEIDPLNLVYEIYTSGSTGRPKGVMIHHEGLYDDIDHMLAIHDFDHNDRMLARTPLSFDPSIWDLILPFMFGGQVVLAQQARQHDPGYLVQVTADFEVTTWNMVTSLIGLCLDQPGIRDCTHLRYIIGGGESMPSWLPSRLIEHPNFRTTNGYGPTETSIRSTESWIEPGVEWHFNSIGRSNINTQIYILDAELNPLPVGVVGQMFIGGIGVGRGYSHRPDLTASRFIPDPFGKPGSRIYNTGDLARWHSDGQIEYLGRKDHQIKLHGVRIELEEVESVLEDHPQVRHAVVLMLQGQAGPYLAAFTENEPGAQLDARSLRNHLKARLPAAMLPSTYTFVEALPRMPNRKLDRNALRMLASQTTQEHSAFKSPGTPLEQLLASIFRSVLNLDNVGLTESFFELGGHSLLVIQAVAQINDLFGTALSLRTFFDNPTIEELTALLAQDPAQARRLDQIARISLGLQDQT
jgi:amino acid adenylation domain-containing protein